MNLGPEATKAYERRKSPDIDSFLSRYMWGRGLDIGYRGSTKADPFPGATGIEIGDKSYDGIHLPFNDEVFDWVHSSHCLEHVPRVQVSEVISEWHRVTKLRGYIIITVPHKYLYERKSLLPSRWNGDHKIFYTPSSLLADIERALEPNSYRVKMLRDCDEGFNYEKPIDVHACGEYEIELVLQRIHLPKWRLDR